MPTERLAVAINGAAMRYVRRGLGITIARLAAEVNVSTVYLRKIELGHTRTVSPTVFAALCLALRLQDRRVLLANPAAAASPPDPAMLDEADPVDDELDRPDPTDDALDAPDPDGHAAPVAECVAS